MVIFGIDLVLLIPALMISATPVLLAAIGEAVVEKSGVLNLGVEGMMITCLLYTSPSPRDYAASRMPSSA